MHRASTNLVNEIAFKSRSTRYSAKTMTDADYAVDVALRENTPALI